MKRIFKNKRLIFYTALTFILLAAVLVGAVDYYVGHAFNDRIYKKLENIPPSRIALVLGTSKYFQGRINLYYQHRLKAAADLYLSGKVDGLLLSGDNSTHSYNEPETMKNDLVRLGVPAKYITSDYAGFRTLDSVVRAKEVFDLNDFIVVSQEFHCQRALYLASKSGLNPAAYCARDVGGVFGLRVRLREVLARFKAFLDVNVINKKPKFLGKKEIVPYRTK